MQSKRRGKEATITDMMARDRCVWNMVGQTFGSAALHRAHFHPSRTPQPYPLNAGRLTARRAPFVARA
jgi:hypothetical protein